MKIALQVFEYDAKFKYDDMSGASREGGEALQAVVADGLLLVQSTGLGGGISRGSGEISFHDFKMDGETWTIWSQ